MADVRDLAPSPTFSETFAWLDGGEVDEYGWMTGDELFTDPDMLGDLDEPRAYVCEKWERVGAEVRWAMPPLVTCDVDGCDEDAERWERQPDTSWVQLCGLHVAAEVG